MEIRYKKGGKEGMYRAWERRRGFGCSVGLSYLFKALVLLLSRRLMVGLFPHLLSLYLIFICSYTSIPYR